MALKKAKKTKSKGSSDWEKELEEEATSEAAREKAGVGGLTNQLSIRKARFTYGGDNLGKELSCIIVDYTYLNTYYKGKFDPDDPAPPTCFALSEDGEDMVPHDNSPRKQSDACEGCPKNEWGSGKGRAKACQHRRRVAIIHMDDAETADDVAEANVAVLTLPVTSVKNWAKYLKELKDKVKRPPHSVITKLSFDTDESYPLLQFELEEKLDDKELVDAVKERKEEIREMLMTPFDDVGTDEGADEDEEEDEDDDDDTPKKRKGKGKDKPRPGKGPRKPVPPDDEDDEDEDEDEEDDDADDDDDEDDDDDDSPPARKGKGAGKGRGKSAPSKRKVVEEDEEEEEEEEDEEEEEEDEDEEEEAPKRKRKGSRFGKK